MPIVYFNYVITPLQINIFNNLRVGGTVVNDKHNEGRNATGADHPNQLAGKERPTNRTVDGRTQRPITGIL